MNNDILRNGVRFILLIALQVFLLNKIQLGGYLNPLVYIVFILLLPFETPYWLLLISSFALGFFVDIFSITYGLHASACVFIAFIRPLLIRVISGDDVLEGGIRPIIRDMGFTWFLIYSLPLTFFHHLIIYSLEIFRFNEIIDLGGRIFVNTGLTVVMIILGMYIFAGKK